MSWSDLTSEWQAEPPPPRHLDIATETAVIAAGWAVWNRARTDILWSRLETADDLVWALEIYEAIFDGAIHPRGHWPALEGDPDPWGTGLRLAAERVLYQLAEILRVAPELGDTP